MTGEASSSRRTSAPASESLSALLAARPDLSMRALAKAVGVSPGHLSRVIRGADGKRASLELLDRLARELGLPADYFVETRIARVLLMIHTDPQLTDGLYDALETKKGADPRTAPAIREEAQTQPGDALTRRAA